MSVGPSSVTNQPSEFPGVPMRLVALAAQKVKGGQHERTCRKKLRNLQCTGLERTNPHAHAERVICSLQQRLLCS